MNCIMMAVSLLLAAFQVQGLALPVIDSITADNETTIVGIQDFQSTWTPTPDTKTVCARNGMAAMTSDFAREADCKQLESVTQGVPGYWDTSDWSADNVATTLTFGGTCYFRVSIPTLPGGDGHIWIGNGDVYEAVGQAVAGYAHAGQVAVMGQLICTDPNGDVIVNWSISG
ncbi:hypothetical protein PG984_005244 [Apiospora sp. TS-2023a]